MHLDNDSAPLASEDDWQVISKDTYDSEIEIDIRFGQNDAGEWGVQIVRLPGVTGALVGPVGEVITSGSARAFAGVFDDPFFFDLDGWAETLANLEDETVGALLGLPGALIGSGESFSLNPAANDVPFSDEFPFLAPAHAS